MHLLGALAGVGIEWFWTGRYVKRLKKEHEALSAVSAEDGQVFCLCCPA